MCSTHKRKTTDIYEKNNSAIVLRSILFLLTAKLSESVDQPPYLFTSNIPMLENGIGWDTESNISYPNGTYGKFKDESRFREISCRLGRPCLRKCCPINQAMDIATEECVQYQATRSWFKPIVSDNDGSNLRSVIGEEHFVLFQGRECKTGETVLHPGKFPQNEFLLSATDGHLWIPSLNVSYVGPESFCLEFIPMKEIYLPYFCSEHFNGTGKKAMNDQSKCHRFTHAMYPIGMSFSIIFLMFSFLVYAIIPELRNLHGKCLLSHIVSLQTAYIFLVLLKVLGNYLTDEICIASGFVVYFSFLSTFLWLNVMCVDMAVAFSGLKPIKGTDKDRERRKFLWYALYAWGLPFMMLCIGITMEFGPISENFLKPHFKQECWFQTEIGDKSRIAYFIGPVSAIIAVNIGLFFYTAIKIHRLKKETALLNKGDSRRHEHEESKLRFNLYLRLFIVMGLNWTLEIISWVAGGSDCIWIPTDMLNTLQGVFIFFIFVWKDSIRRKIMSRFRPDVNENLSRKDQGPA